MLYRTASHEDKIPAVKRAPLNKDKPSAEAAQNLGTQGNQLPRSNSGIAQNKHPQRPSALYQMQHKPLVEPNVLKANIETGPPHDMKENSSLSQNTVEMKDFKTMDQDKERRESHSQAGPARPHSGGPNQVTLLFLNAGPLHC